MIVFDKILYIYDIFSDKFGSSCRVRGAESPPMVPMWCGDENGVYSGVMPPNKPEKLLLTKHHQNVLMMGKLQINSIKREVKNMIFAHK